MPLDSATPPAGWHASLALEFERREGKSVLAARRHDGPLVVQKPFYPEGSGVCHAIIVHPPAGIAGGDDLDLALHTGTRAHALLTTPGAAKWYRSAGPWARQRVAIKAFERGRCRLSTRLWRGGRLAWSERGCIAPGSALAASPAGLASQSVLGTMMVAAPAIEDAWLAECRAVEPGSGAAAVTRLPGILIARYRGESGAAAREYFTALWKRLRAPVLGIPAVEPRIWRT